MKVEACSQEGSAALSCRPWPLFGLAADVYQPTVSQDPRDPLAPLIRGFVRITVSVPKAWQDETEQTRGQWAGSPHAPRSISRLKKSFPGRADASLTA
jgi:hypothetical protein